MGYKLTGGQGNSKIFVGGLMVCQLHYGDAIVSFAIITKAIGLN